MSLHCKPMSSLPPELWTQILALIEYNEYNKLKNVCKAWYTIIGDPNILLSEKHYIFSDIEYLYIEYAFSRKNNVPITNYSWSIIKKNEYFKFVKFFICNYNSETWTNILGQLPSITDIIQYDKRVSINQYNIWSDICICGNENIFTYIYNLYIVNDLKINFGHETFTLMASRYTDEHFISWIVDENIMPITTNGLIKLVEQGFNNELIRKWAIRNKDILTKKWCDWEDRYIEINLYVELWNAYFYKVFPCQPCTKHITMERPCVNEFIYYYQFIPDRKVKTFMTSVRNLCENKGTNYLEIAHLIASTRDN